MQPAPSGVLMNLLIIVQHYVIYGWIHELWKQSMLGEMKQRPGLYSCETSYAVAVARTSASASFERGLTLHSNFSGLLYD